MKKCISLKLTSEKSQSIAKSINKERQISDRCKLFSMFIKCNISNVDNFRNLQMKRERELNICIRDANIFLLKNKQRDKRGDKKNNKKITPVREMK